MSETSRIARKPRPGVRAFLADSAGLAAVELAIILPLALMLMSLVVFGGQAYGVQRRVTLSATTVANIFAQANDVNTYPNLILYPYSGSGVQVVVSQLLVTTSNGTTTGTVCGSWPNANGTARTVGTQVSVDPSIASAFSSSGANNNPVACGSILANTAPTNYIVLGEVSYPFQPTGIWFSVGSITLHDSIIMIPRVASPITVQ
jgi:Flp pilus assembly protein TadG